MRSSYSTNDVVLLLKDITGQVTPQSTEEREKKIQAGTHYCEMLPIEYSPSKEYMEAYEAALTHFAKPTANAIGCLADKIVKTRGGKVVLVSLARAGIPVGILLKRYLKWKYDLEVMHYSISIIRGRGIDHTAMSYLLERHKREELLFVDGWIGKGAILRELQKELDAYEGVPQELAVVADPAGITTLCGTHDDLLIPSSCLNSTVSGLVSRTFLRNDIIKEGDFHGAVFYGELAREDVSYAFIDAIESQFTRENKEDSVELEQTGLEEVREIAEHFGIADINLVKPGIGEATRVLLRRVPWKVLIHEACWEDESLHHIKRLAKEKGVSVEPYPLKNYKACGLIKKMADA